MSRGQLARTPENFPRMKHRAAGRLAKRKAAQEAPDVFEVFSEIVEKVAKGMTALAEGFARIFAAPQQQSDYALCPAPELELADEYERNEHQ